MKSFFCALGKFFKKNLAIVIVIFIFAFLLVCDYTGFCSGLINTIRSVAYTFNPTTDLFDDGSQINYVDLWFNISKKTSAQQSFCLPTIIKPVNKSATEIEYLFDGVIVCADAGVVKSVGYDDEQKYVEIAHSNGYVTYYKGVNMLGVVANDKVEKFTPIAVASKDIPLKFSISLQGQVISLDAVKWDK